MSSMPYRNPPNTEITESCRTVCVPSLTWREEIEGNGYSSKNKHSFIQERFNKLLYSINTIIKCSPCQLVKFQLGPRSWNAMTFFRISELILPTIIQRYLKIVSCLIQLKDERLTEILQAVLPVLAYAVFDCQSKKDGLKRNKCIIKKS